MAGRQVLILMHKTIYRRWFYLFKHSYPFMSLIKSCGGMEGIEQRHQWKICNRIFMFTRIHDNISN